MGFTYIGVGVHSTSCPSMLSVYMKAQGKYFPPRPRSCLPLPSGLAPTFPSRPFFPVRHTFSSAASPLCLSPSPRQWLPSLIIAPLVH